MGIDPVSGSAECLPKKGRNEGGGDSKAKDENDPGKTMRIAKGGSAIHESDVERKHANGSSGDKSIAAIKKNSNESHKSCAEVNKSNLKLASKGSSDTPSEPTESSGAFDGLGTLALACAKMEELKNKKAAAHLQAPPQGSLVATSSKTKKRKALNQTDSTMTAIPSSDQQTMPRTVSDSSGDNRQELPSIHLLNEIVECSSKEGKYITANDVLCGRGGLTNHHPGNVFFRRMVRLRQESYLRACKRDKAGVAHTIVWTIRKLDPPGRFLKRKKEKGVKNSTGTWVEIGDRKAREKTSQALRERAPELMDKLMSSTLSSQVKDLAQTCAPSIPEKARFLGLWEQNQKQEMTEDKPCTGMVTNETPGEVLLSNPIVKDTEMKDSQGQEIPLQAQEILSQDFNEIPRGGVHEVKHDQGANKFCQL